MLECAKFDGICFVDTLVLMELYDESFAAVVRHGGQIYMLEPLQLLATMARATQRLGLSATMSTAFYQGCQRVLTSSDAVSSCKSRGACPSKNKEMVRGRIKDCKPLRKARG